MKIIVCCKIVPDEEEIQVLPNKELDLDNAPCKISLYDLNAIEAGKKLSTETSGVLTALSIGNSNMLGQSKIRKDILSRGVDDLSLVIDDEHSFSDSLETAKAITFALKNSDGFNVVLCGTGSSDFYSQMVGIQVGALLDIPTVNNVTGITAKGDTLEVERTLENEIEVLKVTMPAVLSVASDINTPPVPTMRDIMKAGKKPVNILDISIDTTSSTKQISQLAPDLKERQMEIVEGDNEEAVDALLQFLKKEVLK